MKHYEELELLDSYYLPDGVPEQRDHLLRCDLCRARLDRVSASLLRAASEIDREVEAKPETFWQLQQGRIARDLVADRNVAHPWRRFAVAAGLVAVLSGGLVYRGSVDQPGTPVRAAAGTAPVIADAQVEVFASGDDAWASEELSEFRGVVDWQSWETTGAPKGGS